MRKILKIILSLGCIVVLTVFSCSSDDGSDVENLEKEFQIYLNSSLYKGDGVIRAEVWDNENRKYDYLNIGDVKNGIGTLNFPDAISAKYYHTLRAEFDNSVSISPTTAKGTSLIFFYVISGKDAYFLKAENADETEFIEYRHLAQETTVSGQQSDWGITVQFNINASEGWNAFYVSCTKNFSTCKASENSNSVNLRGIKWIMEYEGNSSDYGGEASEDN